MTEEVYAEGTHIAVSAHSALLFADRPRLTLVCLSPEQVPWFETPIIYDVRSKPRSIASLTGTKGQYSPPSGVEPRED